MRQRSLLRLLVLSFPGWLALACSGSSGGGSGDSFQLTRISLLDGAVWKVNQEIVFSFSQDVDFTSVSLNTINIQTTTGAPATGSFQLRGTNQVVFQPNCPTRADLSDTGLKTGESYQIKVLGRSSGASNTVRSTIGSSLAVTQVRNFTTPNSTDPNVAFLDTAPFGPAPVVRVQPSNEQDATYMEIGGDPDNRVYFELDENHVPVLSVPNFETPLNLYSDPASRIAVVIEFNQAVNPSDVNVSSDRLRLEFLDASALWHALDTKVTLEANCTETGARVRLEPVGILPQGSSLRAVVLSDFQDLVGQTNQQTNDTFAVAPTAQVNFSSLSPADEESDEFPEPFDFGGTSPLSFQDTGALFGSPTAAWGGGSLTAAFTFPGSGGPGGTFDWHVLDGDTFIIDTAGGAILGADGATTETFDDGVINLQNMTIEAGGVVRVQGTKPLIINATGSVIIRGLLDASGFNARDVQQLNTGNVVETGGAPGPGGGRGGNANDVTTNSTPRGGFGQGPNVLNGGGQGGETGFAAASAGKDSRRPGGGAGGRFAPDQGSLVTENGFPGNLTATGALSNASPPAGGSVSSGPFVDSNTDNNFFGTRPVVSGGTITDLIRGELPSLWGGYGGGGGGNADPSSVFPTPNWTPASDEKGGAGGGGGGAVHIRALGVIRFGASGQIRVDGGRGGIGENTLAQDHIGGNGGSGSGGHVILETASFVDFTDGGLAPNTPARDWISAVGGARVTGVATAFPSVSWGGAGGPGVIQLQVPDTISNPSTNSATSDIVVTGPVFNTGNPLDAAMSPAGIVAIPAFGSHSQARSKWISIGGADQKPSSGPNPSLVRFIFQGTNASAGADEGKILTTPGVPPDPDRVQELTPLLDEDLEGNLNLSVLADRLTLQVTGTSLAPFALTTAGVSNDIYLRNPTLLENFVLRLSVNAVTQDFVVASARYDEGAPGAGDEALGITVADQGTDLQKFIEDNTAAGTVHYQLIPRFFSVLTGGAENVLPSTAFVRVRFQAAADDGFGSPDENNPLVDWTGDISQFNALGPGQIQFFRFEVEFELDAQAVGVTPDTQAISLDFLRVPFVF